MPRRVVVFDSQCLLCSRFIKLLINHDDGLLFYTGFESQFASENFPHDLLASRETVVFYDDGIIKQRSEAVFAILGYMPWYFRWLRLLRILPKLLLDKIYDWIARNRYSWFGRANKCFMPQPSQHHKFLA